MAPKLGWLFATVLPAIALAQSPPDRLAAQRTSLVGGHLTVALPVGMKMNPRSVEIMSAPHSELDETRAVYEVGKVRFVMMADERYVTASGNSRAAVEAEARHIPNAELETLPLARPLIGYGVSLALPRNGATLVYIAWVVNADETVDMLGFFVNEEGAKNAAAWSKLGRRIVTSARAGTRRLDAKRGVRVLGSLRITVPDGWVARARPGPDFVVYELSKLTPIGNTPDSCGIFVGGHPAYGFRQVGLHRPVLQIPGTLLGATSGWVVWRRDGRSTIEAMAGGGSRRVHVFCSTSTEGELGKELEMAETLHWKSSDAE